MQPVEDVVFEALMGEGRKPDTGFSLAPIFSCFHDAVLTARRQERQAILDALLRERKPSKGRQWNAGFNAAFMGLIRVLADRSQADDPDAAGST